MSAATKANADVAKQRILAAAVRVLSADPGGAATVDRVAGEAGCAKGLVHYHFKTKDALFAAAAAQIWAERGKAWRAALTGSDPHTTLQAAWQLLLEESRNGHLLASTSLGLTKSKLAGQSVKDGRRAFVLILGDSLVALFGRMGRAATVPASEIAALLASVIDGLGLQLAGGDGTDDLEPAWSAFWAAVLSLTRPR